MNTSQIEKCLITNFFHIYTAIFAKAVHFMSRNWMYIDGDMKECILRECEGNPSTSLRLIVRIIGVIKSIVWKVLHEERLFPYHLQKMQSLKVADYLLHVDFFRWILQQSTCIPSLPAIVLFTDEATFTRDNFLNLHISHV